MGLTVQMTKSLTLFGNLSEGKHSKTASPGIGVLECVNNIRNHALNNLDKFHWKDIKSTGGPTEQMKKSLTLLDRPIHDCPFL